VLELRGVRLKEDAAAFDHVFNAGEICVVLGANLAGKTDLCRLVAGLPTQASLATAVLDGVDLVSQPTRVRSVALVTQAFVNYPNWTVAQNIGSPIHARTSSRTIRARRSAKTAIAERVDELAQALGLSDLLARYPHELSGGEQQRVALARALAKDARVLLLDEPLVNLDYKLREALQGEFKTLLHDRGTIVVYTTSEPHEALALGDHALLLRDGELLQADAPLEVYCRPNSLDAMDLMSQPRTNRVAIANGTAAVRPEHVSLQAIDDAITYQLHVIATETNGSESFVHGSCDGADWVVHQSGITVLQTGETVPVYVRREDLLEFSA
jgi:glycerol transport system ATP-binding protein